MTVVHAETWEVTRHGQIEEVEMPNGIIKYRLVVSDPPRHPFIELFFKDLEKAKGLLEKIRRENGNG